MADVYFVGLVYLIGFFAGIGVLFVASWVVDKWQK